MVDINGAACRDDEPIDINGAACRDDEPIDGEALAPWVWAFLGEFPAAGIALGPTLAAWQQLGRRSAEAEAGADVSDR